jgi:hypothetical protein
MSITLTAAVNVFDGVLPVSAAFPTDANAELGHLGFVQVDNEVMRVRSNGTSQWLVDRAVNGTLAAAHASGAVATPLYSVTTTAPIIPVGGPTVTVEAAFVAAGAGTYTATIPIPAGATVLDVVFRNTVVWDNATSAAMTCGDTAASTGYFTSTNVKTTPAADTNGAGAGLSTRLSLGASAGAYKGGGGKFYAAGDNITCAIVAVGAGSAGRSRVLVSYTLPTASVVVQS